MADKPKADTFAGEGSIAGKLKKRREAYEAGDPSEGQLDDLKQTETMPEKLRPTGSGTFSMAEINLGYRCIKR
jgi:hypothetical protein